jgi:glutamate-ammonia-ligase adenylyltransferase
MMRSLPASFRAPLKKIPAELQEETGRQCHEIRPALPADVPQPIVAQLVHTMACSPWMGRLFAQQPALIEGLITGADLNTVYGPRRFSAMLEEETGPPADENILGLRLRRLRQREMARIIWRDVNGLTSLVETVRELSWLAEAALEYALAWLYADECRNLGTPLDPLGQQQRLSVIGLGKLGGSELNLSSDIDLMFAYGSEGETRGGPRALSNQEFFDHLGRRLIRVLHETTAEGFVFRVDMRLRPFGDGGALTLSVAAMQSYYETHASDWERYALIKARVVAGDRALGETLLAQLRPFVYRRYLDFGALSALREMKREIEREVERLERHDDIKRGAGGIREIEFIAQLFQLIRGGREPQLCTPSTLAALRAVEQLGLLPAVMVAALTSAYVFLRNTEHRLQAMEDQQTQVLPGDVVGRARLAYAMGYPGWEEYTEVLDRHLQKVCRCFEQVLAVEDEEHADKVLNRRLRELCHGAMSGEAAEAALRELGLRDPAAVCQAVAALLREPAIGRLTADGQARLQRLLPLLLRAVMGGRHEIRTLQRLLRLVEAAAGRSVYLALLAEYPKALRQLTRLLARSSWITDAVCQHPVLLDELLDTRALYAPSGMDGLEQVLRLELTKHPAHDLERHMETLRQFRQAEVLKVAAADLTGHLPLPEVSNHLTWIAETVLRAALQLAWDYLASRHGEPHCTDDGRRRRAGFAIIAYGKLGGFELGYGSDLDLVFLHDSEGGQQLTDGRRPLDNVVFFTRLAQRLIHLLSTVTPAGMAYDVDTRLRPSGATGLLVSSMVAYREYQRRSAWTWEHQALVRARGIAGDAAVINQFTALRDEVLARQREPDALRREVVDMREQMRRELNKPPPGRFDLKQGPGGVTDIEFMVQYGVLAHAASQPALLCWTDNLRLLGEFSRCGLLSDEDCVALREAYFRLRGAMHRCTLQGRAARVKEGRFETERAVVTRLWRCWMLGTDEEKRNDNDG